MITYPNAVDENGDVHNIGSITQENRAAHKYFCLGCDKEMVPVLFKEGQKEDHFRHKVNDLCNPETYLHNLAKKHLAKLFETSKIFEVSYYAHNECPRMSTCKLLEKYHFKDCSGVTLHTIDLKEKYDTCQIEGVYDGYRADVLLTNSMDESVRPLFIEVSVSHDCTPEKLASGNQIIEIKVRSEADFKRPITENKGDLVPPKMDESSRRYYYGYYRPVEPEQPFIMFHGFERELKRSDIRKVDFFALRSNGKICLEEDFLPCGKMESFHLKDSLFEVLVYRRNKGYRPRYNFYNLGLAEAMLNKMPIRHCVHCVNYGRCTIPMECQVFNRRTGQVEKGVQQVFNYRVKEDKVDKYELADKCNNWKLNEASCQRIISDYQHHDIFIWTPDMDDLPE